MLTWGDLRRWDPAAIGKVADALNDGCIRIIAANDDVEAMARIPGWTGEAALAAFHPGRVRKPRRAPVDDEDFDQTNWTDEGSY